jgi:hypothetical protein
MMVHPEILLIVIHQRQRELIEDAAERRRGTGAGHWRHRRRLR